MGCSFELFLAVDALRREKFEGLPLKEITAALQRNGIEVTFSSQPVLLIAGREYQRWSSI